MAVIISIKGNKFYLEDDTVPSDDFHPENQHSITAYKKGNVWKVYHDTKGQVYRRDGYAWTEFDNAGGGAFASEQALSDWFDVNTGNKGAGGGGGVTLGEVNTAITNSQTAQDTANDLKYEILANKAATIRTDGSADDTKYATEKAVRDMVGYVVPITALSQATDNNRMYSLTQDDAPALAGELYFNDNTGTLTQIQQA